MWTGSEALARAGVLACLSLCGCEAAPGIVRGVVNVDGKPLANGVIVFYAPGDDAGTARAAVKDGHYELKATPGAKIVQITAPIVVDKRKDSPDAPWTEFTAERLPPRYHSASQLRFDVTSGDNVKDWELTTK